MTMTSLFRKTVLRQDAPPHPMIESIREICSRIEAVQSRFSMETDPDLIEGCIFELEALQAQYRYFLKLAREQGITCREKMTIFSE